MGTLRLQNLKRHRAYSNLVMLIELRKEIQYQWNSMTVFAEKGVSSLPTLCCIVNVEKGQIQFDWIEYLKIPFDYIGGDQIIFTNTEIWVFHFAWAKNHLLLLTKDNNKTADCWSTVESRRSTGDDKMSGDNI